MVGEDCVVVILEITKFLLEGVVVGEDSLVQLFELENPSHRLMPSSSSLIFSNFYPLSILMLV